MRAMKDSGVKWIGDIPESWDIVRFKLLHNGLNTGEAIDKEYWTADNNDATFYTAGLLPIKTNYPSFPAWKYTNKNDLLLARNGTPYVYLPDAGSCYTDHIIRAEIKKQFNRKFIRYSLQQSILSEIVDSVSLATWSASLWNEQVIAWPAPEIQQRVVDYLDAKCAEIDALISAKEKTNALLKERRQSIIYEAVTKGLDPTVPMKESGVEWIGEIPEGWELKRLKYLGSMQIGLTYSPEEIVADGALVLRSSNIQDGKIVHADDVFVGKEIPEKLKVEEGDILICSRNGSRSLIGKNAVITEEFSGQTFGAFMTIFRGRFNFYIKYLLNSSVFDYYVGSFLTSTINQLTTSNLSNILVPVPSTKEEMRQIAEHIEVECQSINLIIARNEVIIQKLKEYRQSLIYEAVTGKIEI